MHYYNMKPGIATITAEEFKTHFEEILEEVQGGLGFAIAYGKKKELIGYFLPPSQFIKPKRKLGLLEGIATVNFNADFEMTDEELFG